jgi:hypothetical protein
LPFIYLFILGASTNRVKSRGKQSLHAQIVMEKPQIFKTKGKSHLDFIVGARSPISLISIGDFFKDRSRFHHGIFVINTFLPFFIFNIGIEFISELLIILNNWVIFCICILYSGEHSVFMINWTILLPNWLRNCKRNNLDKDEDQQV